MLAPFAQVMIGFSLCAAVLLLAASLTVYVEAEQSWLSRASGVALLGGLALLQWMHGQWLQQHAGWASSRAYVVLLFVVAAAFFLFFRGALQPKASERAWRVVFYLPALLPLWLPSRIALPLAFLSGTAYAAWLAALAFRLRAQRARFRLELGMFAAHALVAFAVLLFGVASPWLGFDAFVVAYASLIGVGLFGALYLLLRFPDLPARAAEAVATAYAVSTLSRVDREAAVARLRKAMDEDRAYLDEELSLARLAAQVELTPHQLSELVNTAFGVGFSRYVRGHRVEAAKRMLVDEPGASVLSIGLAVGFTSQSNFYAAFRELTGEVPGRYRRRLGTHDDEGAAAR